MPNCIRRVRNVRFEQSRAVIDAGCGRGADAHKRRSRDERRVGGFAGGRVGTGTISKLHASRRASKTMRMHHALVDGEHPPHRLCAAGVRSVMRPDRGS
jgi:hypothetical protein